LAEKNIFILLALIPCYSNQYNKNIKYDIKNRWLKKYVCIHSSFLRRGEFSYGTRKIWKIIYYIFNISYYIQHLLLYFSAAFYCQVRTWAIRHIYLFRYMPNIAFYCLMLFVIQVNKRSTDQSESISMVLVSKM
jgi:hypothetical protein